MKKNKTLFIASGYLLITVLLVAGLILFNSNQQNSAKFTVLISENLIKKGTEMDKFVTLENNSPKTIRETEQHKSYKDLIESGNDRLITVDEKASLLSGSKKYIAVQDIQPNEPLKWSMFTNAETITSLNNFIKPQFCKIPVDELSIPADGFEQNDDVSIVAIIPYEDDKTINLLTDKAVIYNTVKSDEDKITHVIVIVEETIYPTVELYANGGDGTSLRFLKGKVDSFALSSLAIKENSYSATGITTNFTDVNVSITPLNSSNEASESIALSSLAKSQDKKTVQNNVTIVDGPTDFDDQKTYQLSYVGPCNDIFIYHYDLDGKKGKYTGTYSHVATNDENLIIYDANTQIHTLKQSFDTGYYKIAFFKSKKVLEEEKANLEESKTLETIKGYSFFVIEDKKYSWQTNENNKIILNSNLFLSDNDNDNLMINFETTKSYFNNITDLEGYSRRFSFSDEVFKNTINLDNMKDENLTDNFSVIEKKLGVVNGSYVSNISLKFGEDITIDSILGTLKTSVFADTPAEKQVKEANKMLAIEKEGITNELPEYDVEESNKDLVQNYKLIVSGTDNEVFPIKIDNRYYFENVDIPSDQTTFTLYEQKRAEPVEFIFFSEGVEYINKYIINSDYELNNNNLTIQNIEDNKLQLKVKTCPKNKKVNISFYFYEEINMGTKKNYCRIWVSNGVLEDNLELAPCPFIIINKKIIPFIKYGIKQNSNNLTVNLYNSLVLENLTKNTLIEFYNKYGEKVDSENIAVISNNINAINSKCETIVPVKKGYLFVEAIESSSEKYELFLSGQKDGIDIGMQMLITKTNNDEDSTKETRVETFTDNYYPTVNKGETIEFFYNGQKVSKEDITHISNIMFKYQGGTDSLYTVLKTGTIYSKVAYDKINKKLVYFFDELSIDYSDYLSNFSKESIEKLLSYKEKFNCLDEEQSLICKIICNYFWLNIKPQEELKIDAIINFVKNSKNEFKIILTLENNEEIPLNLIILERQ